MATITYLNRPFAVLETRQMSTGLYGKINIGTSDRPAHLWRLIPVFDSGLVYDQPQPCRAIILWRPTVILTPELAANVNHVIGVEIVVRSAA